MSRPGNALAPVLVAALLLGGCGCSDTGSPLVIEMYGLSASDEPLVVIDRESIESFEIIRSPGLRPNESDRVGKIRVSDPEAVFGVIDPTPGEDFRIVVDGVEVWGTIWDPSAAWYVEDGQPALRAWEVIITEDFHVVGFDKSVLYLDGAGVTVGGVDLVEAALQAWKG